MKLDQHKDLVQIANNDPIFETCETIELERTKAFRVKKGVYGQERVIVVTYNQNPFDAQWLTFWDTHPEGADRSPAPMRDQKPQAHKDSQENDLSSSGLDGYDLPAASLQPGGSE